MKSAINRIGKAALALPLLLAMQCQESLDDLGLELAVRAFLGKLQENLEGGVRLPLAHQQPRIDALDVGVPLNQASRAIG